MPMAGAANVPPVKYSAAYSTWRAFGGKRYCVALTVSEGPGPIETQGCNSFQNGNSSNPSARLRRNSSMGSDPMEAMNRITSTVSQGSDPLELPDP